MKKSNHFTKRLFNLTRLNRAFVPTKSVVSLLAQASVLVVNVIILLVIKCPGAMVI